MKALVLRFPTLALLAGACLASYAADGVLLFRSGFEDKVAVKRVSHARVEEHVLSGTDSGAPAGADDWDLLATGAYLPWVTRANAFLEGGSMEITRDPKNPDNRVLHFHNIRPGGPGQRRSRTQWSLKQVDGWTNDGALNRFERQFYRYRMFIPADVEKAVAFNETAPWYGIWESHAWALDPTRHAVRLFKKAGQPWRFQAVQEHPVGQQTWEDVDHPATPVPFGEWFTLEVFFKYHETDGEFFVAITRQGHPREIIGQFRGKTKYGAKLHDQMVFKMYHSAAWFERLPGGTHQYYDDFEIWSDFPPGYFDATDP